MCAGGRPCGIGGAFPQLRPHSRDSHAHVLTHPPLFSYTLHAARAWQSTITAAAFAHLRSIKFLRMAFCDQRSLSATDFGRVAAKLKPSLTEINMAGCSELLVAAAKKAGLPVKN